MINYVERDFDSRSSSSVRVNYFKKQKFSPRPATQRGKERRKKCSRGELNPPGCAAAVFQSPCGNDVASPPATSWKTRTRDSQHFAESFQQLETGKSRELKKKEKMGGRRMEIKRCQEMLFLYSYCIAMNFYKDCQRSVLDEKRKYNAGI